MFVFHPLSDDTRHRLLAGGLDPDAVAAIVRMAVAEDLMGGVDVTSVGHRARRPAQRRDVRVARATAWWPGSPWRPRRSTPCAATPPPTSSTSSPTATGSRPGDDVARVDGADRSLLTAERTALNLLCHLSGVATLTRRWADALEGTGCVVRDTRKTTPGLRALEKYAVRCGGGANHRMGLSDAALVKDNHVAGGRRRRRGVRRRAVAGGDDPGRDRGRLARRAAGGDRRRRRRGAARQLRPRRDARRRRRPRRVGRAVSWRPAVASRSRSPGRSARPASTTSPSAS